MFQGLQDKTTGLLTFTVGTGAVPAGTVNFRGLKVHPSTLAVYAAAESVAHASYLGGLSFDVNGRLRVTILPYGTMALDGVSGSYASVPDTPASGPTGDIDIRWFGSADDWTPAGRQIFISKWTDAGGNNSYVMGLETSGRLSMFLSPNGTTQIMTSTSISTGFTDGTFHGVRCTWTNSDNVVKFYTRTDDDIGSNDDWTQLDVDKSIAADGIHDSTAVVEIGSVNMGTVQRFVGEAKLARVLNGVNGTTVVNFDASDVGAASKSGSTSDTFVDELLGDTWTLHGGTEIYMGVPFFPGGAKAVDLTGALYIDNTDPAIVTHNNSIGYDLFGKIAS